MAEQRYYPYGGARSTSGELPTDRRYTGQRWEQGLGLYDYNARFYDPALARFISADTIVPQPGNPQDLNRYAYVRNNPLRYSDPTGHYIFDEDYPDPTSAYYPVGLHAYGSTYFLSPQDAEAILGASVPQRVRQGYIGELNDPKGLAMPIIAFGMALCGNVAGLPMPQASRPYVNAPPGLPREDYIQEPFKEPFQTYYPPNRGFAGQPVKITLEPGTVVDRYGGTGGSFASPRGTLPEARSLPYGSENKPLNAYQIVKPLQVDAGPAARWFGQPGGGIQYDFGCSVQELIDSGYLKPLQ